MPEAALIGLAEALAKSRRLGTFPGWRYGGSEGNPTLMTVLRLSLLYRIRALPSPLVMRYRWVAGLRLELRLENELGRSLFIDGTIEPNEFALLGLVLEPGMTFVDVGANEGLFTLLAASRVGERGRVIAIEPSSRELARLRRNLELNGFANVKVVATAVADVAGQAALHIADDEHAGHNTLGAFAYEVVRASRDEAVPVATIDSVVADAGSGRVDVIKMDIEGGELRALRGAAGILRDWQPLILLEISEPSLAGQHTSAAEVLRLLGNSGYQIYAFDDSTGLPQLAGPGQPLSANIVAMHRERSFRAVARARPIPSIAFI